MARDLDLVCSLALNINTNPENLNLPNRGTKVIQNVEFPLKSETWIMKMHIDEELGNPLIFFFSRQDADMVPTRCSSAIVAQPGDSSMTRDIKSWGNLLSLLCWAVSISDHLARRDQWSDATSSLNNPPILEILALLVFLVVYRGLSVLLSFYTLHTPPDSSFPNTRSLWYACPAEHSCCL